MPCHPLRPLRRQVTIRYDVHVAIPSIPDAKMLGCRLETESCGLRAAEDRRPTEKVGRRLVTNGADGVDGGDDWSEESGRDTS